MPDEATEWFCLVERHESVARRASWARRPNRLNESIRDLEDALSEYSVRNFMVAMPGGRHLSWDGECLWVIDRSGKAPLLTSSRRTRVEACSETVFEEMRRRVLRRA